MNSIGIQHRMDIHFPKFLIRIIISSLFMVTVITQPLFAEIDHTLLEKVQRDSFKYFLDYTPYQTGLTHDSSSREAPCSIAAVGFYLASIPVAMDRGWISKENAYKKVKTVLTTLKKKCQTHHGFFYHFIDAHTGKRAWGSEISSIDTALLMAGVLIAGKTFKGTSIDRLAQELYANVEWPWLLNKKLLFSHGYTPEKGLLPYYWDTYSEHLILCALAIGSPTHPVSPDSWNAWNRFEEQYNNETIVYSSNGSLFTYQFPHAFIDFRKLRDHDIDYFTNSQRATTANKAFCAENRETYRTYAQGYWGLSACIGPNGYKAYGAPPSMKSLHDGTIAPYAAISSIVFTPDESFAALKNMFTTDRYQLYGPYGFKDAFNIDKHWVAKEYLGIDQGITLLMIENYRSDLIWNIFMNLKPIQKWIKSCNLAPNT